MSRGSWQLSALEFAVLWERLGRDRLPYPFRFRGTAGTLAQFQAQRAEAARRVLARIDEPMYEALTALAEPAVRIELCGLHGDRFESMVRVHAGIRCGWATVAVQQPGSDPHAGADVRLTVVPACDVGTAVVRAVPPVSPGRHPAVSVPRVPSLARRGTVMSPAARRPGGDRREEFFTRPRTGLGEVTVFAGPAYDNRPGGDGDGFHWIDLAEDGRYLVHGAETVHARPAGHADLAAQLLPLVAAAEAARLSH
ncbi:ESX secretion-associated protein EspG [Rhodococcus kronopolitis]|uniref:ESX secretion-associated protein EspG n=1 Tax=Rhodococcus kronopolitis TaxID=1460226 RepID=A0ABV9FT76_9NOCA